MATIQYTNGGAEDKWEAHYKRMNEYMQPKTTSDRNTPFEETTDWDLLLAKTKHDSTEVQYNGKTLGASLAAEERSLRYNNGKPDYSLIPLAAMKEAAHVLEYGATKYAIDNWMKPTNWRVSYACLMRHMSAWQSGEDLDPESQRNHLGHAMCNILQMLYMLENHPEELER